MAQLAALFGRATGTPDRAAGYNDAKAAWDEYLTKYNKGRGIVLGNLLELVDDQSAAWLKRN